MNPSALWEINSADWGHTIVDTASVFLPPDIDAALVISYIYFADAFSEETMEEWMQDTEPFDGERLPVTCGDFSGWKTEYIEASDDGEDYTRVWWLFAGHVYLHVHYGCSAEHVEVHRDVVDRMLGTLKHITAMTMRDISVN